MHQITIAIDDSTLAAYKVCAAEHGRSLNDVILDVLHTACPPHLSADSGRVEAGEQSGDWFDELMRHIQTARGNSGGWRFNREDIYDR